MGKNKKSSNKSKAPSLAGPNALPIFVIVMIALFLGIALLPFPKKDLDCNDHVAQAQYPPSLEFTPRADELDRLLAGYPGTDVGDHFHWMLGYLQDSSLPVGPETIQYLQDHQDQISFIFESLGPETMALVGPEDDLIEFTLNYETISDPTKENSFLLMMGIVHETVHVEQYLTEGSRIAEEQGISLSEAYQQIFKLHENDAEEFICWEMEAWAREMAYYKQLKHAKFVTVPNYFDDYLVLIEELDWNWKSSKWAEFIRSKSDQYKHELVGQ